MECRNKKRRISPLDVLNVIAMQQHTCRVDFACSPTRTTWPDQSISVDTACASTFRGKSPRTVVIENGFDEFSFDWTLWINPRSKASREFAPTTAPQSHAPSIKSIRTAKALKKPVSVA